MTGPWFLDYQHEEEIVSLIRRYGYSLWQKPGYSLIFVLVGMCHVKRCHMPVSLFLIILLELKE